MKWKLKLSSEKKPAHPRYGAWNAKMEAAKRKLADRLQRQSEKLSIGTKKTLLATCCLLFGSFMLLQVFRGLGNSALPDNGTISKPRLPPPLHGLPADTAAGGLGMDKDTILFNNQNG